MDNDIKVYCKNCKYIKYIDEDCKSGYVCTYFHDKKIEDDYVVGKRKIGGYWDADSSDYPNRNYNCKYYKRKWWKFWVED